MKNKEITIYELLGLIKDRKAPIIIKYDNTIWGYEKDDNDYYSIDRDVLLLDEYIRKDFIEYLNDTIEILPEENDEWEDIEECSRKEFLDLTSEEKSLELYCYIRDLIKNQKYLKEKLEEK